MRFCLILAQKINKCTRIKGLSEFYLFQAKYSAIFRCLILFCMRSCIFLSSRKNVSIFFPSKLQSSSNYIKCVKHFFTYWWNHNSCVGRVFFISVVVLNLIVLYNFFTYMDIIVNTCYFKIIIKVDILSVCFLRKRGWNFIRWKS